MTLLECLNFEGVISMRNSLALLLLAGACCLLFSQQARADVNTITNISYYQPTNSIYAYVDTVMDYDTYVYYSVAHWGYYYKNSNIMDMFAAQNDFGEDAYSEEFFPYDPNRQHVCWLSSTACPILLWVAAVRC